MKTWKFRAGMAKLIQKYDLTKQQAYNQMKKESKRERQGIKFSLDNL